MDEKFELLEHVYKDASMGEYTIEKLLEKLKDRDNKIKGYVEDLLKEYQQFAEKSREKLKENNQDIKDPGIFAKMGSSMGISKEVKEDNSDSAIADMLIEGMNMGVLKMQKKIKAYDKELDKDNKKLAEDFLKFQEKAVKELEKYL